MLQAEVHPADCCAGRPRVQPRLPLRLLRAAVPPARPQLRHHPRCVDIYLFTVLCIYTYPLQGWGWAWPGTRPPSWWGSTSRRGAAWWRSSWCRPAASAWPPCPASSGSSPGRSGGGWGYRCSSRLDTRAAYKVVIISTSLTGFIDPFEGKNARLKLVV